MHRAVERLQTFLRWDARRLLKAGRSLLVVAQTDQVWTGVRERRVVWRLEPLPPEVSPCSGQRTQGTVEKFDSCE